MQVIVGFLTILLLTNWSCGKHIISFKLAAKNLPEMDGAGIGDNKRPDPFVVLEDEHISPARSETLEDNKNPTWGTIFHGTYYSNENQTVKVEIRDNDPWSFDEPIGWTTFTFDEILNAERILKPLKSDRGKEGGTLIVEVISGVP